MPFYKTILFTVIILSCLRNSVIGQSNQISLGKIAVEDGLSQNSVISITRDNPGALWLKSGKNKFSLLGGNYDGVSHDVSTDLEITIQTPWWKTKLAFIFGLLAASIFIIWIHRFHRNRRQLKAQLQLEHLEKEKWKDLDLFKSRLYINITHEFRTPLTVILGLIQKSSQYYTAQNDAKFNDAISIVQRNANVLLNLVNQMLDLSRLESKSIPLHPVNADIVPFLKNLVAMYESHAANFNLSINFHSRKKEIFMDYDPDNLQKIVSNLMSNAIKFTDKGEILLLVNEEQLNGQNCVKVVVKDTGIGISKENLPYVFDRFYQVDDAEKKTIRGSGIGMALVKELIHLMGGDIELKSEPRVGTTVTFFLPVTNNAETSEQPSQKLINTLDEPIDLPKEWEFSEESDGNPIVLLIEDNTDVLYYLNICLHENYRLVQARDGNEGIKKAIDLVPDIIISDVIMPGKTGIEVCETLKEDTRTSHIPIILLTAKAEIQDKISGIKHGADAYLIKPFIVDELLVQVENLIRTREILIEKFRNSKFDDTHRADYPVKENKFLTGLNSLIKEELSNTELNVDKVCEQLYMSRTQLHRKIKALTNKSITAYIRSYRLHEALNMIKESNLTIQQIAYETGFSDASYFHRSFLKEFNKKPTDFRKL